MKKIVGIALVLVMSILLCACGQGEEKDYYSWLPDGYSGEVIINEDATVSEQAQGGLAVTDASYASNYYETDILVDALLGERPEELAGYLWEDQIANGVYSVTAEELNKNMLTYYVSSSEGDDNNLGISPDAPKKTLSQLSGKSNITVLLKCGDTFEMDDSFSAGSNCIYATYGKGPRPVVSYYMKPDRPFKKAVGYTNIWQMDLLDMPGVYNTTGNKDNCNLGQLVVDGEVNWKRLSVSSAEAVTYDFAKQLETTADGAWAIDWLDSVLYYYSEEDPNQKDIKVAPDVHGVVFKDVKNTTLKGWTIEGAGSHGCNLTNTNNVTISSCFFHNIGGSIHVSAGIRYGNAVQVWDGGINVTIAHNYADWVFDTCYTNQGSNSTCYGENIIFENNIGAHSFTGIETWGDSYSTVPFKNLVYRNNIIYDMCDITDSDKYLFAGADGQLVFGGENQGEYISYRGGYTFNQMACINVANSEISGELKVDDNVFWNTNRLLVLVGDIQRGYPSMNNNLFYAEVTTPEACLYRYKDFDESIRYVNHLMIPENTEHLYLNTAPFENETDIELLKSAMSAIITLNNDQD